MGKGVFTDGSGPCTLSSQWQYRVGRQRHSPSPGRVERHDAAAWSAQRSHPPQSPDLYVGSRMQSFKGNGRMSETQTFFIAKVLFYLNEYFVLHIYMKRKKMTGVTESQAGC